MDKKIQNILIVDDDEDVLHAAKFFLKQHAEKVRTLNNPELLRDYLMEDDFSVILLDMNYSKDSTSGLEGIYWLSEILRVKPGTPVIMITAYGDVDLAVKAIKKGAVDFILKPWDNRKLLETILSVLRLRDSGKTIGEESCEEFENTPGRPFRDIVGISPAMNRVFDTITKVAKTDANVLIIGENGTGKELVARAIHNLSYRAGSTFVGIDTSSYTAGKIDDELFGHEEGASHDALTSRAGRFELASGGTLFIEDIQNLSSSTQARLMKTLETKEFTRNGSLNPLKIDIRFISSISCTMDELTGNRKFRPELLYMINTVEIFLPPLRDRKEDISLLAGHFTEFYCNKYSRPVKQIGEEAMRKLEKYPWPGNVRELKHTVERAAVLSEGDILMPEDFRLNAAVSYEDGLTVENYDLSQVEKNVIIKVLEKYDNNVSKAARELGLTRASLYRRMEKYDIRQ